MPAHHMVRTDVLSGRQEHLLAYLLTGVVVASAEARQQTLGVAILLALVAAVLELGQFASPGREPTLADFVVSALGGFIGTVLVFIVTNLVERYGRRS